MAARHWVLFQEPLHWQIGWRDSQGVHLEDMEIPADAEPDAMAAAIAQSFSTLGYQGEGVLLAVHSSLCLAATMMLENPASAHQPQALLYQFEQATPSAAEDLVADFVIHDLEAFGVAMLFAQEKSLVDHLEQHGIQIQSITPTALLAIQDYVHTTPSDESHLVLWQHGDEVEWVRLSDNKPRAWRFLPAESSVLFQHLRIETLTQTEPLKIIAQNLLPSLRDAIAALPGVELQEAEGGPMHDAALLAAEHVLVGTESPWIELRRDALGTSDPYRSIRGSLRFAVGAAAVMLVAMIGGWSYQAYCLEQSAAEAQQRQATAFCEAFPGQPVPTGICSRLKSEYVKLAGLKGASDQLPLRTSAMNVLYDILASLPDGMRYRFRELRLDRQRAFLEGEVLSHGDAGRISNDLQKRGFQVQPPRTQQLAGQGVSIRLIAELSKKARAGSGGGT